MSTAAKRQRKKAARQARIEAEQRAAKRRRSLRRSVIVVVVLAAVGGISYAVIGGSHAKKSTTTTAKTLTTLPGQVGPFGGTGGSGDRSPAAITTAAHCPSNLSATLNKPSWTKAPLFTLDVAKTYTARVTTDVGSFTIALDTKQAPIAVNNFVFLARQHFYDCVTFHRVIQGFMDQTGDPTGTGSGGPGYQFTEKGPAKATPQYPVGSVAMANANNPPTTDPTTNGSQFFVVTGPAGESLPPDYVLFGQVTSGMSVLQAINAGGAPSTNQQGTPKVLHRIISVTISTS